MNKKNEKNLIIFSFVVLSVTLCSIIWKYINLNISNVTQAQGAITLQGHSTDSDTLRYVVFILLPLFIFAASYYLLKNTKTKSFIELITLPKLQNTNNYNIFFPTLILFIFIILQFFSLTLPVGPIDTFHDGELFSVTKNVILNGTFFIDTYTIHGFSDIFYPLVFWKLTGLETIGSGRLFFFFLNLLIKFFCLILSYQLIKFSNVKNKTIFFIIFSLILLSFSDYQVPINFSLFSYRDIYIILYLIFLTKLFNTDKESLITNFFLGSIPPIALIMHIDTGVFLFVLLTSVLVYFIINKKFKISFQIISFTLLSLVLLILIFGSEELNNFIKNALTIIVSMDYLHGTEYPQPFFSIGDDKNGMRATRGLLLQLSAGLFVIYNLITKKNTMSNGGKVFFIFLFFLSFIMYKNALGRSDSYHIRMSNDLPILINSFFILNLIILKIEKHFTSIFLTKRNIIICSFILCSLIFFKDINFLKIKDYPGKVQTLLSLPNNHFIDENKEQFVKEYIKISAKDKCFQNFTDDLILLYLINKPSCTKFVASWLASPEHLQDEYIASLKNSKPNYIVYKSEYFKVDGIEMSKRLQKVDKFIQNNYKFFQKINTYDILKLKN